MVSDWEKALLNAFQRGSEREWERSKYQSACNGLEDILHGLDNLRELVRRGGAWLALQLAIRDFVDTLEARIAEAEKALENWR
jgi:predicted component of type VI protein secretion system